jgi:hypothetical protein
VSDVRKAFGLSGLALVPICCLGVPLLVAAGISVAALVVIGGITVDVIVGAAIALLIVRAGRSRGAAAPTVGESARRTSGNAE